MAQRFDLHGLRLIGTPTVVAEHVLAIRTAAHTSVAAGWTGTLAYISDSELDSRLDWYDRRGNVVRSVGVPSSYTGSPSVSPDGGRIAGRTRIHQHNVDGTGNDAVLVDAPKGFLQDWSRDGQHLIVGGVGAGHHVMIWATPIDAGGRRTTPRRTERRC